MNSVVYAWAHNNVCWLSANSMNLGKKSGSLAGYFVATTCCLLNANNPNQWVYANHNYLWQQMGFHSLSSKTAGMMESFINDTQSTSNRLSWLNAMEDRPGWFTGDNSVIVWSFGAGGGVDPLEDVFDTHYNAKLKGQYKAYPRGATPSCSDDYGQGSVAYELRDHGQDGCP